MRVHVALWNLRMQTGVRAQKHSQRSWCLTSWACARFCDSDRAQTCAQGSACRTFCRVSSTFSVCACVCVCVCECVCIEGIACLTSCGVSSTFSTSRGQGVSIPTCRASDKKPVTMHEPPFTVSQGTLAPSGTHTGRSAAVQCDTRRQRLRDLH